MSLMRFYYLLEVNLMAAVQRQLFHKVKLPWWFKWASRIEFRMRPFRKQLFEVDGDLIVDEYWNDPEGNR